jgi:hypothetical protein
MERSGLRSSELLKIIFKPGTRLLEGPSLDSYNFLVDGGSSFEICPGVEQNSPDYLKVKNPKDNSIYFLGVPETNFPCPIKNSKPNMSLYEVMIATLEKYDRGNNHLRILTSIGGVFESVGEIQNPEVRGDFFDEVVKP